MIHPSNTSSAPPENETEPKAPDQTWPAAMGELLAKAAALGAQHDLDLDSFMRSAWAAYLEARPGMREYLEDMQLRTQLDEYRKSGRMGRA